MLIYLCPSDKKYHCSWEGHAEDILDHFEKEHDDLLHYGETFDIDLETPRENRLFLIDEEIYLTQVFVNKKKIIFKLRYLGLKQLAKKITYNIIVRIGDVDCDAELIKTTAEGFLEVDLATIKNNNSELQQLGCILNVLKGFSDNDDCSIQSVLSERRNSLPSDSVKLEESVEEHEMHVLDDIGEENEIVSKEVINDKESVVEKKDKNIDKDVQQVVQENEEKTKAIKPNVPEVSSLHRSKTSASDESKRRWNRANSTMSLGSIQEIDNSIICNNCNNCLKTPIYICPTGHHFCEQCQTGDCNICKMKITFVRDADLEKFINKFSLSPCQFQKYGCPERLLNDDLHQHEANCSFCLYKCPISECLFEGQYKGLCKHLKLIHSSTKLLSSFILSFNNYPEAFLANEEKGIFYCYVIHGIEDVVWVAKYCGSKDRNFFCELKFKDGKMKEPVLLKKDGNVFRIRKTVSDLKRLKVKPKNAVLTITY